MSKGEEAMTRESWKLSDLDVAAPYHQHIQQVVRPRMGEKVGYGVLEQIVIGPHERYGFKDFLTPLA
jgi:hypothetical protein